MELQLLPKKHERLRTMELELPEEIVLVQILSRLPVKSLLRCRCVCKLWRDWISGPQFKFSTQRRRILVFSGYELVSSLPIPCIDVEDASVQSIPDTWHGKPTPLGYYDLLGSCNGFVLIALGTAILLWNPSTRSCNLVLRHYNLSLCLSKKTGMSGLCYDSSTNDYKVIVRFIGLPRKPFKFSSLRKQCWTKVDDDISSNYSVIWGRNWGAVVNGNQHWLVKKKLNNEEKEDKKKYEEVIIYFDAGSEKFSEIPIPVMPTTGYCYDLGQLDDGYCYGLGELDGCLALGCRSDGGTAIEIWVMNKNYNVAEESFWTLCCKCPIYVRSKYPFYLSMQPLCFTKDSGGEVLMVKDGREIVAHSPKTKEYRSIHACSSGFIPVEVAHYVESLVSHRV